MKVYFNTLVKNEEILLSKVLPIWKQYPIDKFVFYNDNSTDNTVEIIKSILEPERIKIINNKLEKFHESNYRARMLQYSRFDDADFVLSIDCDELLSSNLVKDFQEVLKDYEKNDTWLYWYNVVGSLEKTRNDPFYLNSFRSFILPLKHTGEFDLNQYKYHSPRVPDIDLPKKVSKEYGVIHLQAINKKFYALKQLWYKHYELKNYKHSIAEINNKYDFVINNLNFMEVNTPTKIIENIYFDSSVFDKILEEKKYKEYILENFTKELVTFGEDFLK